MEFIVPRVLTIHFIYLMVGLLIAYRAHKFDERIKRIQLNVAHGLPR